MTRKKVIDEAEAKSKADAKQEDAKKASKASGEEAARTWKSLSPSSPSHISHIRTWRSLSRSSGPVTRRSPSSPVMKKLARRTVESMSSEEPRMKKPGRSPKSPVMKKPAQKKRR